MEWLERESPQYSAQLPGLSPTTVNWVVASSPNEENEIVVKGIGSSLPLRLSCQHAPKVVFVVDALDECEREKDIAVILRLLSHLRDLTSVYLRIFVTIRALRGCDGVHIRT